MAQLLVRNIDDALKEELKKRARQNGRSLEAEVRERLRSSIESSPVTPSSRRTPRATVASNDEQTLGFGSQIVPLYPGSGNGSTEKEVAEIEAYGHASRPDPYFWRDYGRGERDYGFTQEDFDRMEEIKREPIPEPISFE